MYIVASVASFGVAEMCDSVSVMNCLILFSLLLIIMFN